MENYQIQAIRGAFKRCFGLRDGVIKISDLQSLYIDSLSNQTGLRVDFINSNLELIKNLQ